MSITKIDPEMTIIEDVIEDSDVSLSDVKSENSVSNFTSLIISPSSSLMKDTITQM